MNRKDLPALCKQLRRDIINMIANGASGHPGGSLSVIDMLVALYFGKMNLDPCEPATRNGTGLCSPRVMPPPLYMLAWVNWD